MIVWDVASHSEREILHGHAGRAFGTAFDGNGSTAFTVGLDGRVIAWDLVGGRRVGRAPSTDLVQRVHAVRRQRDFAAIAHQQPRDNLRAARMIVHH